MRHKISNNKLSRKSSSRKALLRGLVTDTIKHGKIKTTKAKAKEAKPILEKLKIIIQYVKFQNLFLKNPLLNSYLTRYQQNILINKGVILELSLLDKEKVIMLI